MFQDPIQDTTSHFVMFPLPLLNFDNFSLSLLLMILTVLRSIGQILQKSLNLSVSCFPHVQTGVVGFGKITTYPVMGTYYQYDLSLMVLTLVNYSPPFYNVLFGSKSLNTSHVKGVGRIYINLQADFYLLIWS